MKKSTLIRLPLQFFAESGDNSASADNSVENAGGAQEENTQTEPTLMDLIRTNKNYQSEYDKLIGKSNQTARENERKKVEAEFEEKARVEKMSADEKRKHEYEKEMAQLEVDRAEIAKRELVMDAKDALLSKGLSPELHVCLNYSSKEECLKSVDILHAAITDAAEKQVNEKLKGGKPPAAATGTNNTDPFLSGLGL